VEYCKAIDFRPNFTDLLRGVCNINPEWAQNFAIKLYHNKDSAGNDGVPLIEVSDVQELFYQRDMIKELTALMVDVLAKNEPSQSRLQTRYLEILLLKRPDIANALFSKRMFTEYDQV
jgi:hypothetical protein